jgi:hypothetical protein
VVESTAASWTANGWEEDSVIRNIDPRSKVAAKEVAASCQWLPPRWLHRQNRTIAKQDHITGPLQNMTIVIWRRRNELHCSRSIDLKDLKER